MQESKTPLESIGRLTHADLISLSESGIESVEDLLAKIKSYGKASGKVASLLGLDAKRIPMLIEEARKRVSKEFLDMLDAPFDSEQFYFGALPPEENEQERGT